jgi:hypothetical protein
VVEFAGAERPDSAEIHPSELIGAFTRVIGQITAVNTLVARSNLPEQAKARLGRYLLQASVSAFAANTKMVSALLSPEEDVLTTPSISSETRP